MTGDIEVIEIRRLENAGNIRAVADVRLGGITICGVKIIRPEGHRPFVRMPDRPWTDDAGTKRWALIIKLSDALKRRVDGAVLAEWERG